jgi:hypothetical protein
VGEKSVCILPDKLKDVQRVCEVARVHGEIARLVAAAIFRELADHARRHSITSPGQGKCCPGAADVTVSEQSFFIY